MVKTFIFLQESFLIRLLGRFERLYDTYEHFVFGLLIGALLTMIYHRLVGLRSLIKSHKEILNAKDETIRTLKLLVCEKLEQIKIPEHEKKDIWAKIIAYFKGLSH